MEDVSAGSSMQQGDKKFTGYNVGGLIWRDHGFLGGVGFLAGGLAGGAGGAAI